MAQVTVKVTRTHFGEGYLRKVGTEYQTEEKNAAYRKMKDLVEYDGPAAPKEQGQKINVSDKSDSGTTTTAIVEQDEETQGKLISVEKEKVEKSADKEKKEVKKPTTKK